MRNMSFAFTEDAIREQRKTVTRRLGWLFLHPGDEVQPVRKGMGLRKGERVEKIGPPIRIVRVTREPLAAIGKDGFHETAREGFGEGHPKSWPSEFVGFFCRANRCTPDTEITRIEFVYTGGASPRNE